MKHGLILLAHGARSPTWARPFEALADHLRVLRPELQVALAFLELMSPSLTEAAESLATAGCSAIDVIPCFLGQAGHVTRDVPPQLDEARARHPSLTFRLHSALGEQTAMQQAMAQVCLGLLEGQA
jgi:sirohydrochlorin cobaltochelatase